jgi:undecaprenyl diphosphate synthase
MCIDYGGRDEITRTTAALARRVQAGHLEPDLIDEEDFARHLPLTDLPDVGLLWRTGNEQRTSNFFPCTWSTPNCTSPPACDPTDRRDLWRAVTAYTHRQRRHHTAPVR